MKVWSAIFNMVSVVLLALLIIIFHNIKMTNDRQFEELRLSQAVDYAVEAAFRSSISTDTVGTDYIEGGLEEVLINPSLVLDTFYNILSLSYDMSASEDNFSRLEQSIATAVLCASDGYYVLNSVETDNSPNDIILGQEYKMDWGIKRPYIVYSKDGTRIFTANLVNEKISELGDYENENQTGKRSRIVDFKNYVDIPDNVTADITKERVSQGISKRINEDINAAIYARNVESMGGTLKSFYLPASSSLTAINNLKSPTLLLFFQDSSFLNGYELDVMSVGGSRVRTRVSVIGYTKDGTKYYCYAGQQLGEPGIVPEKRFDTLHQAALAGYSPDFVLLQKRIGK